MDKREIKQQLERYTGGVFITRQKLADALGVDNPRHVDRYLSGLDRINGKYYLIEEVAGKLMTWRS